MKKHLRYNPFFLLVWILSVFAGFLVFYDPFWGSILVFFFDFINGWIVCSMMGLNRTDYYKIDKIVDWINYTCMLMASISQRSFIPLLLLFVYRLFGYLIYLKFKKEWLFILFPNLLDFVFFWYAIQNKFGGSITLGTLLSAFPVILILKESQEVFNYIIFPNTGSHDLLTGKKFFGNRPF